MLQVSYLALRRVHANIPMDHPRQSCNTSSMGMGHAHKRSKQSKGIIVKEVSFLVGSPVSDRKAIYYVSRITCSSCRDEGR